ncbi:MAG TPA: hypothetical protein VF183_02640 [Acidimicrobiales bacterium]
MDADALLRRLADAQLGLVHHDQINKAGLSRGQLQRRVETGVLERVAPRVFRFVGSATSAHQRALAAVLDAGPGAALSHRSAAAWWGIPGHSLEPLHVIRGTKGNRRTSNLATLHDPRLLLPNHVVRSGAIPVTTPSRTLFDLASMVHVERLEHAVDHAIAERLTNARALHVMLDELAKRGRTGIAAMREVLERRPIGYRAPESRLELRVEEIVRLAGLPLPERQVDIGDEDGWIARVDYLWRVSRFVLQVDGSRWHTMLFDRLADEEQQRRLERAGYRVRRVTEAMVYRHPRDVVVIVREGLGYRPAA